MKVGNNIENTDSQGYRSIFQVCVMNKRKELFFLFFLFKSCIHLFVAEPEGRSGRYKELACNSKLWRKQDLCENLLLPA